MAEVTVAAVQMAMADDTLANLARAEALLREAAARGAGLALLPELFAGPYFCKDQDARLLASAAPAEGHPLLERFEALARELHLVLPVSFFERAGNAHFNAVAVIDADGRRLGIYRKSHIPDGPGYQEKFYFSPGDTGFRVWDTGVGRIGVGICWDQWFPEAARIMALQGAEILLYPTAIGSEPQDPSLDTSGHWQRVMQGHAAANMVPVVAANRWAREQGRSCAVTFYGGSFVTDGTGAIVAKAGRGEDGVVTARLDLEALRRARAAFGLFRDRRPDLYRPLLALDGRG
jgi:N-carbamoylputrescine amidase